MANFITKDFLEKYVEICIEMRERNIKPIIEDGVFKGYTENGKRMEQYPFEIAIIPDNVKSLFDDETGERESPFYMNKIIKAVVLPKSLKSVGFKVFFGAENLELFSFSSRLRKFGVNSLLTHNCIEDVYFDGDLLDLLGIRFTSSGKCFHYLHCKDCTLDFHRRYFIDVYKTDLTVDKWKGLASLKNNEWLIHRINTVICEDGVLFEHDFATNDKV